MFVSCSKKPLNLAYSSRNADTALSPAAVSLAPPPPLPPVAVSIRGYFTCLFMESTSSHAGLEDMPIDFAASEMEPYSFILSSRTTLPYPRKVPSFPSIHILPINSYSSLLTELSAEILLFAEGFNFGLDPFISVIYRRE